MVHAVPVWQAMAKEMRVNKITLAVLITLGVLVTLYVVSSVRRRGSLESQENTVRLSELISASIDLAARAGKIVVEVRGMDDAMIGKLSKGLTKEGKKEYVTIGDKESHQIIVSGLKSLWPGLQLQSEESDIPLIGVMPPARHNMEVMSVALRDESVSLDEVTVWVDPLDATQEYTEGKEDKSLLKFVTVMVCVAVKGYPIAGIIHEPFNGDGVTNWGWVGHGVSHSLWQDEPNLGGKEKDLRVIYSRSHPGEVSKVASKAFSDSYNLQKIEAGGSGYKVLEVARGNADLYLHVTHIKKWDICAGNAVLNALRGKMTALPGTEVDYSFKGSPVNEEGLLAAVPESLQHKYLRKVQPIMSAH